MRSSSVLVVAAPGVPLNHSDPEDESLTAPLSRPAWHRCRNIPSPR